MVKVSDILRPHEWIGLGAGIALAAAIYAALIHPSLRLVGLEEEAGERRTVAERELSQLRTEYQQLLVSITEYQQRLKALGGSPPLASEKDRQIARVTALANDSGVKVDQFSPIETVDQDDHQAVLLQFVGRASYAKIREFFRRMENEIDFVDITHFSLSKVQREGISECQVSWSCRITGLRPAEARPGEKRGGVAAGAENTQHEGSQG